MTQATGVIVVCGFPVRWAGNPPTEADVAVIHDALTQMVSDVIAERLTARRAADAQ